MDLLVLGNLGLLPASIELLPATAKGASQSVMWQMGGSRQGAAAMLTSALRGGLGVTDL